MRKGSGCESGIVKLVVLTKNRSVLQADQWYKYRREVYYHGIPQDEYESPMLRLLN